MKIEPSTMSLLKGEVGIAVLTELDPEVEVQYEVAPSGRLLVVINYNDDHTEATVLVTASQAGVSTVIFTQGLQSSATLICTVKEVSEYTYLTADGSGEGNDTTVFGRQYIINENLSRVDDIIDIIQRNVNSLKNSVTYNNYISTAALGAIAGNLITSILMLTQIRKLVKATGKNEVDQ